jgi:hypothetical protein
MQQRRLATAALIAAACTTHALASNNDNFSDIGPYVVGQAGVGSVYTGFFDDLFSSIEMQNNTGFAGRLGIGYQMNRYFGVEGGITKYPSAIRNFDSNRGLIPIAGTVSNSKMSQIYTADVMAAVRIPMGNTFYMSLKGGMALMHVKYTSFDPVITSPSWEPGSAFYFAPKTALELGVKLNPHTSVFLAGSYIYSVNGSNVLERNYQPGLSMYSLGVSYSF